jgi:Acetyltransferase (GNAT) domain
MPPETMEPTNLLGQYEISVWEADYRSPLLQRPWGILASSRDTSATIYQSSKYFDYLQDIERTGRLEVLTVKDKKTDAIVGVVPAKLWVYRLEFKLRTRTFVGIRLESIGILGGEPMVPEDPDAFDGLFLAFTRRHPTAQVIYMDPVPSTSYLWHHLQTSPAIRKGYDALVLGGFRERHSVPLPKSLDEYHRKLSRKKRYNLARQERLLRDHCGNDLELITIEKEEDLPTLFAAIGKLPTKDKPNFVFREDEYIHLSRHNLLHCYVLKSAENVLGLLLGMKAGKFFKIDRLFHDRSFEKYSPGTTLWQLVLKDLINGGEFICVDFGYGLPAYQHRSTNIIENKGRILLFRRSIANRCLILAYTIYSAAINFISAAINSILHNRRFRPPN